MSDGFIDIEPGARVSVVPSDGSVETYEAVVRSVTEAGVALTGARRGSEFLEVEPGEDLSLFIHVGRRPYRFAAMVASREESAASGFTIEAVSSAEQAQRRQFFRLQTRLEPSYACRVDDEEGELPLREPLILDISGGGVRLRTLSPVRAGGRVRLAFALDDDPLEIEVEAEALSVVPPKPTRRYFHVHCRFVDVPRAVVERIVRFVFRQQVAESQRRAS